MARGTKPAQTPAKKAAAPAKAAAKKAAPASKSGQAKKVAAKAPAKKSAAKAPAKKVAAKAPAKKVTTKATVAKKAATPKKTAAPKKAATPKKTASAAKPTAPKKARSPFSAKFLAAQERLLHEERSTYMRQFESLRAEAASLVEDFESGDVQFDEESGEGDTINIERERDLALSEQARAAVVEIDHALAKLPLGTYGICEVSGEPIPEERLEAIPWARERVEFKTGGLTRR